MRGIRSLHLRIMAWSFVPTALILFAVALATFFAYQQVAQDLVIGRNQELTRLSAAQLASGLSEYTDVLASLGRALDRYHEDPAGQQAVLATASNRLVVFDAGTILLNSHGLVVAAQPERPDLLARDLSDCAYYQQMLRTNAPTFSDIVADGPDGAEVIVVAVPVTGEQGEFHGMLAGMFRLDAAETSAFYGDISKLHIGQSGNTYLVDAAGRAIYHSDPKRVGQNLATQKVVQQALARQVGFLRGRDMAGRGILATYAPVPGTPWSLISEENWAALLAASSNYSRFLYPLLALGVAVPAVVVAFLVRRITGPIAELIHAAQEVAGGRFGRKITVNTGDELEELAKQFNAMSAQLEESYARLEQRVADRTRELAALNAIAAVVSRTLDLDEILHNALDKTMELTSTEVGIALRLDAEKRVLTLMAAHGPKPEQAPPTANLLVPITESELALLAQPFARPVAGYPENDIQRLLLAQGVRLAINVPLVAKGRVRGLIVLGSGTLRELISEELVLLAAIGQQIGMAMENARLYEQAEQAAAAAERNRLARDLHDAVSQTLFSATLIAEVLPRLWERNPEEGQRRLAELRELTRGALAEMRTLLLELRPSALVEAALGDLLRQLGEAVSGRSRVPVCVQVEGQRDLPPDVRVALYRIAQEALNNVARHSGASQAWVRLLCEPWGVALEIHDNGRGFDINAIPADHLGLNIMRERAQAIGAALSVESEPGEGTQVAVIWRDSSHQPSAVSGQQQPLVPSAGDQGWQTDVRAQKAEG